MLELAGTLDCCLEHVCQNLGSRSSFGRHAQAHGPKEVGHGSPGGALCRARCAQKDRNGGGAHAGGAGKRRQEVREFSTYNEELVALRDWLVSEGATQVVMEATGVYWRPVSSPSTSPNHASRRASSVRATRLSRISTRRPRWAASGQSSAQRTQACSCTHDVAKARPQVPTETLRFSKCPRKACHSSSVGVRYSSQGAAGKERDKARLQGFLVVDSLVGHSDSEVAVAGDHLS